MAVAMLAEVNSLKASRTQACTTYQSASLVSIERKSTQLSAVQCSSVQQVTFVMIGLGYMAWWLTAYVCVSAKAMALLHGWGHWLL